MKAFLTRALAFSFPCLAIAQVASLQITVLDGEGAAHPAGAHISSPLTVQVTDDRGQPVAEAAVTFQLPANGPGGLFSNGLRTDFAITDGSGRATVQSIQLNRNGGQFSIRITAVKQLTRDLGKGLHSVQQARATVVSFQSIVDTRLTPDAPAEPAAIGTPAEIATPAAPSAERSAEIMPVTDRPGPRIGKKWIVLAAIAAACAGAATAWAVTRSINVKVSAPTATTTIGTPTVIIGNP